MSLVLNKKEKGKALLLALFLSFTLHFFLPFCDFIYSKAFSPFFGDSPFIRMSIFPWAAILLFLFLKPKGKWAFPESRFLLLSTPLPLVVSYFFGRWSHWPETTPATFSTYYWYVVCIPIGEEFLFRGWAYEIFERLFAESSFTYLLDFPTSHWMTSLMFSLWHLQNLNENPTSLVLFQVVYTFFTGLWLSQIRLKCRNPIPSCIAHSLLNLAATIP